MWPAIGSIPPMTDRPDGFGRAYCDWMVEKALPFWADAGWWADRGCFYERLDLTGAPLPETPLRVRTQARQIYTYAHAHVLGWGESHLDKAEAAMASLRQRAWAPDRRPGWAHVLTPDGAVANPLRDAYDHAFILHALAWMGRATGDVAYYRWADETLAFMDDGLKADHGGWAEDDQGSLPRRQNPHMHAFEAMLALYECTGDGVYRERADRLYALFMARFLDRDVPGVREFFDAAWNVAPGQKGDTLEPGHFSEWVWLLRRYGRNGGAPEEGLSTALLESAQRLGLDERSGFLIDEVWPDGRALSPSRRLWVQTEYLKALTVEGRFGEGQAVMDRMMGTYLADAPVGAWCDRYDGESKPMVDHLPASTLYHLFGAVIEVAGKG